MAVDSLKSFFHFPDDRLILVETDQSIHEKVFEHFPKSCAFTLSKKYQLPQSYYSVDFWNQVDDNISSYRGHWLAARTAAESAVNRDDSTSEERDNYVKVIAYAEKMIDTYDAFIPLIWNGDRRTPPVPIEFFNAVWGELKEIDAQMVKSVQELGHPLASLTFDWPVGKIEVELDNEIFKLGVQKRLLKKLSKDGAIQAFIASNILILLHFIYTLPKDIDIEEQEDMFTVLVKLLNKGKVEMTAKVYEEIKEAADNLADECNQLSKAHHLIYENLPKTLDLLNKTIIGKQEEKNVRKSARERKRTKIVDWDEVKKTEEKVKKKCTEMAKETKKIARMSAPAGFDRLVKSQDEYVPAETPKPKRGRPRRETKPVKIYTPPHPSIDAETDSMEDDDDEIKIKTEPIDEDDFMEITSRKKSLAPRTTQYRPPKFENKRPIPYGTTSSIKEIDIILMNERIFMESTKLHLMSMKKSNGRYVKSFIPTIMEAIEKALNALDIVNIVAYAMHKAAVELGVSQLILELHPKEDHNGDEETREVSQYTYETPEMDFSNKDVYHQFLPAEKENFRELDLSQL